MAPYSPITVARFWSKVDVKPSALDCWEWKGASSRRGYGKIKVKGESLIASRVAWEIANNAKLGDLFALHKCDNPKCCNPAHIFAGTNQDNMDDMRRKGRVRNFSASGAKNPRAKLTADQAIAIKKRIAAGEKNQPLADEYGVSDSAISLIRRGKAWASV